MGNKKDPDGALADFLASCYTDPLKHVMGSYPWTTETGIQIVKLPRKYRRRFNSIYGPDEWCCAFLDDLGREIKARGFDGAHAVKPILFSTSSGHGIGKSCLVAWLIKFIMDTRPFAKGIVTATTAEQLKTKTWAELGKWHRLSLTPHWFRYNSGRGSMMLVHKDYPQEWRCDAQTCREENSEAFAGLHAANSTPFYIFDEASGVPDKIFDVREGGTTDGEPMVFDFGNPTRNSGRFFENCAGRFKHRYRVRRIDSRDVQITNKSRIREWIDDYGVDSDFIKIRVRGTFPSAGSRQFMASDDVEAAMTRPLVVDQFAPLVIGVDVARFGHNESVIYARRGRDARSFVPKRYRGLDTVQLTGRVIETIREFRALGLETAALFVDGTGIGGAVVDQLRHLGYDPIEVHFSSRRVLDKQQFYFKVDEIWGRLRDAIQHGLCLPEPMTTEGILIKRQATQRDYFFRLGGQVSLVSKDAMEEDGLESPDIVDALALTYAEEAAPVHTPVYFSAMHKTNVRQPEYDPLLVGW